MIYTVTLNPSLDYIMYVPSLTLGAVSRAEREMMYPGGKGVNVSIMLARLGIPNRALGFIAGFTGLALESMLKETGCDTGFIRLPQGNTRINVKLKGTQESDINAQGPHIPPAALVELFVRLEGLAHGDTLVLAGAIADSLPRNLYEKIMGKLEGRGIRFVVDATGRLLKTTLARRPFLVKPNNHELGDLFGVALKTKAEVEPYARRVQRLGARNVLVSMAENGALLLTEDGRIFHKLPPKGNVVNSVGAGDSMVAGFLMGMATTGDYEKALDLGLACGSASAFQPWLATKEDVMRLLDTPRADA